VATFDDHVIVSHGATRLFKFPLSQDLFGTVTMGDPVPVELIYKELKEGMGGRIIGPLPVANADKLSEAERKEKVGTEWAVVVIESGVSANRNFYPEDVLRAATPLYEGAKVFWGHTRRGANGEPDPRDTAGVIRKPQFSIIEGKNGGAPTGAIVATLRATDRKAREMLMEAYEAGQPDLVGLSHTADAEGEYQNHTDGQPVMRVKKINAIESVDLVSFPSAGGRVLRLVAGMSSPVVVTEEGLVNFAQKLKKIQESRFAGMLSATPSEAEVDALLRVLEAEDKAKTAPAPAAPAPTPAPVAAPPAVPPAVVAAPAPTPDSGTVRESLSDADRSLLQQWQRSQRTVIVEAALTGVNLPAPLLAELRESLASTDGLTAEAARAAVAKKVEVAAALVESFRGIGSGAGMSFGAATVSADEAQKVVDLLDDLMMTDASEGALKAYEAIAGRKAARPDTHSIKEAYVRLTGDQRVYGRDNTRTREGLVNMSRYDGIMSKRLVEGRRLVEGTLQTTTWAEVFGDSIARRMLAEYRSDPGMMAWKIIASVVPLNDFRTQRRIRWGGYGDLPTVLQADPYTEATTPGDEEATYAAVKRGYVEGMTWEALVNDDLNQIRSIPVKMGRAAARTLFKFVTVTNLASNPNMTYDATALFAVGHSNLITTALSATNLETARQKLADQTDMSTNEKLNLYPSWLMVPTALEALGWRLINSPVAPIANQNATEPSFIRSLGLNTLIVNPYLTDANDWFVGADKSSCALMEIGFLFGQEEPTIVIADMQNVGSFFTSDVQKLKIRHVYGGAPVDHRAAVGGIVA
jgi:hypothetical protein